MIDKGLAEILTGAAPAPTKCGSPAVEGRERDKLIGKLVHMREGLESLAAKIQRMPKVRAKRL